MQFYDKKFSGICMYKYFFYDISSFLICLKFKIKKKKAQ